MIKICLLGIIIATCALTLVLSVMQGFEIVTYQKMQSIYPDLILDAQGNEIDMQKLSPILKEQPYHITHFSEQIMAQGLLYNKEYSTTPSMISIKGINPEHEEKVTTIGKKLIYPYEKKLHNIIHNNHVVIGQKLAQQINVSVGDKAILLYTNDEPESLTVQFKQSEIIISGIFKTGIDDFDTNLLYCSNQYITTLFEDNGITQVYLKLKDYSYEQSTIEQLEKRLHVKVYSWKDLYPTLVSTMKLEKYVMFFILLLIVLIACMNLISLTFMYITQKKKEIALFICLGMPLYKIKLLFTTICLIVTTVGSLIGLMLAYIIGRILQTYPFITLPDDIYITTYLPIELDPLIFCVILISSLSISLIASIIATKKLHALKLVQVLKQE